MRIFTNIKHRHVIHLIFLAIFFTSLTKFMLEGKASTCSMIKENVLLYSEVATGEVL